MLKNPSGSGKKIKRQLNKIIKAKAKGKPTKAQKKYAKGDKKFGKKVIKAEKQRLRKLPKSWRSPSEQKFLKTPKRKYSVR